MSQYLNEQFPHAYAVPEWSVKQAAEAYIRPEVINNEMMWAIYDGNGEKIGHANSREMAMAVVFQNELTPFSVH